MKQNLKNFDVTNHSQIVHLENVVFRLIPYERRGDGKTSTNIPPFPVVEWQSEHQEIEFH